MYICNTGSDEECLTLFVKWWTFLSVGVAVISAGDSIGHTLTCEMWIAVHSSWIKMSAIIFVLQLLLSSENINETCFILRLAIVI